MSERNTKSPEQMPSLFERFPETPGNFRTIPPAYWSPYKTADEKMRYEAELPTVIQPFVRSYFQKHAEEMHRLQQEPLPEYTHHLKSAWKEHLAANRAADTFLTYELGTPLRAQPWSIKEWDLAARLLKATMGTDHIKAMYSSGVKAKLDSESKRLKARYGSQDPTFETKLLTPSFLTFYEERDLNMRKYQLSELLGTPDEALRKNCIDTYNGGDTALFDKRNLLTPVSADADELRKSIEQIETSAKDRAVKKGYFIAERADLKDFEELLKFDNVTEYEYTYSLQGLTDLYLREEVLDRLKELQKTPGDTSVFELAYSDFERMIDEVRTDLGRRYVNKVRSYRQQYDTCGTVCVMSLLNLKGLRMDEDAELRIWNMVGKPYNFPGGLASVLLRQGFAVTYVQDSERLLDPNNPEFASMSPTLAAAAETYVELHREAVERGLEFQVSDWGYDRVKDEISRGNFCILYLYVNETMTHVVLAHGLKDDEIVVMDPLGSIKKISADGLNSRVSHPMGKRLLIVNKLPHDFFRAIDDKLSLISTAFPESK